MKRTYVFGHLNHEIFLVESGQLVINVGDNYHDLGLGNFTNEMCACYFRRLKKNEKYISNNRQIIFKQIFIFK